MPLVTSINIFSNKSPVQAWRITRREIVCRKEHAFDHKGYSLSYSGPDLIVSPKRDVFVPFPPRVSNLARTSEAIEELKKLSINAVWLDGSPIGQFLFNENDLYQGLEEFFTDGGVLDRKGYERGADYVMSRVSRAYIKSAFGYAATAVCGADPKRIFFCYEMPPLLSNSKILLIDDLPRPMVQEFNAINKDEAFQLICWAELLLSKSRMEANDTEGTRRDFFQRQYYLNNERKLRLSKITSLSKKWEHKREEKRYEIFSKYAPDIHHPALKDIITEIRPLCPTVVSFPSHVGSKAFRR